MKYYKFVSFQLYEFNTTNWYVTNQNKLAIEKTYEFVWNSACIQKEKNSIQKGAPPWAQVCRNLYIYYENISDTNQKK